MTSLQVGHFKTPGPSSGGHQGQGKVWIHGEDICENATLESSHCPGHNTRGSLVPFTDLWGQGLCPGERIYSLGGGVLSHAFFPSPFPGSCLAHRLLL